MHPKTHTLRFKHALSIVIALGLALSACAGTPTLTEHPIADDRPTLAATGAAEPTIPPTVVAPPSATATPIPIPAPLAVELETAPGVDGVADLGLTQVRIARLLRGPDAQLQLPVDQIGRAPEGYGWVYIQFALESQCTAEDDIFEATGPTTHAMFACALNTNAVFEDTTGRAYPADFALDANDQVLSQGNAIGLRLHQDRTIGFAALLPESVELRRVSLERFYFDPSLFTPLVSSEYDARRNVIFVLGGADLPVSLPAPDEPNKVGWDSDHLAQVGDTIVTPAWKVRLVSIQEGDAAIAAAAELGLVPRRAYTMDYLVTLELTCQGSVYHHQYLPTFRGDGEDPHTPVGFHDWTPAGQEIYPQAYYPGARFMLYLTGHPKPGNRPVQIHMSYEDLTTWMRVDRFLAATDPNQP